MSDPAYLALADEIEAQLGLMRPGQRVTSEHQLARAHGVSRLTARAALGELESRLLVRRIRGSGTFVTPRILLQLGPGTAVAWSDAASASGVEASEELVSVRSRRPSSRVRKLLELDPEERAATVVSRCEAGGFPVGLASYHLPCDLLGGGDAALREVVPPRALLDRHLDLQHLWSRAELVIAPHEITAQIGGSGRSLTWWVESCEGDPRLGRPVLLTQLWASLDAHRVVLAGDSVRSRPPGSGSASAG